ncbi:calcium-independent phospholipase A2-gamma-like isoform X1 [Gadus macrocephalus]|uniref:calcium-independent phospholipase A2-gamma-like isoform X1 n=2 Tax=Gadus macrocephalus TaxID=80720 RepID=UPI0028CB8DFD|nr:calcium-independent phospholipase A2-gamma-like isoform X1 [Gadus macrocephalus]XP_059916417.1 calcium-independent phospholipase A2-gamma-like isoform X1 [Gadus macrocephalus]
MAPRWPPDTLVLKVGRAVHVWQTPAASLALFPLRSGHCRLHVRPSVNRKFGCLSWKSPLTTRSWGRKGWLCRARLHTSRLCLNASTSRWFPGFSQHMSRIRSTLDTVSKAVSGTHTELKSKIARLKPAASQAGKEVKESGVTETAKTVQGRISPLPPAPSHVHSVSTAATALNSTTQTPPIVEEASNDTSVPSQDDVQATVSATVPSELDPQEKSPGNVVTAANSTGVVKKQEGNEGQVNDKGTKNTTAPPQLFHPSTFSVSLDETYSYLANHVNNYFGSTTTAQEKASTYVQGRKSSSLTPVSNDKGLESTATSSPSTQRKGFGHYLSYSAPTVQAFVGNYIRPLVPKFRAVEPKSAEVVQAKVEDVQPKPTVAAVTREMNATEERAKRLLLQREKIIARLSIDNRTRALVQALHRASDVRVYINRVEDLSYHLLEFPDTRGVAVKERVVSCLLRLRQASDPGLRAAVREALSLVGYHDPVKGRGIRLLSIDGGGLRGLLALQTLHKLEAQTGKPIYQLFDYICGVSTGAILGFMLGIFQYPLSECEDMYRKLGSDVFKQNRLVGTVKMGWNHAFYDSEPWEKILKEKIGSDLLVETSRNAKCPKVSAVSAIVNQGTPLKAYVFRNYNLMPGVRSHYLGGCQHQLWQALRASSAAPGYFQEFALGPDLHQDGGLLINNPTALAIHECQCLWPGTPLECVVSLGTGRFATPGKHSATHTSLKTKLVNVISSATDTEEVHTMLDALLPTGTYFRFNPYMSEEIPLDESRQEKLNLLQAEAQRYLGRNEEKMKRAAAILTRDKGSAQRLTEWAGLRADMHGGLRSLSRAKRS